MFKKCLRNLFIFLALIFCLGISCASYKTTLSSLKQESPSPAAPLLNSERIAQKFGSYGLQLLLQDELAHIRLANLYSEHKGEKIMRTLAFTRFEPSMDKTLSEAHRQILEGGSIGATLKKLGFQIEKKTIFYGLSEEMPPQLRKMMHSTHTEFATLIYDLFAFKDGLLFPYCTITEIYSPSYLTLPEIEKLHKKPEAENIKKAEENLLLVRAAITTL